MKGKILEILKRGKLNYTAEERTKDNMKIFTEAVKTFPVHSYGVSMLLAEEYIKLFKIEGLMN